MINISMCIIAKNEAHCIADCINSIQPFVNEVLIVDDHSTDDTVAISRLMGARVESLPFHVKDEGFAAAVNYMVKIASHDWVCWIDADELMPEIQQLHTLTRYPGKEVWALPRRKWLQYPIIREEYEAYPDWQVRLFKRNDQYQFEGHMHIKYNCPKVSYAYRGPHVEHRQYECSTRNKNLQRDELYPKLASIQGVTVIGGHPVKQQ